MRSADWHAYRASRRFTGRARRAGQELPSDNSLFAAHAVGGVTTSVISIAGIFFEKPLHRLENFQHRLVGNSFRQARGAGCPMTPAGEASRGSDEGVNSTGQKLPGGNRKPARPRLYKFLADVGSKPNAADLAPAQARPPLNARRRQRRAATATSPSRHRLCSRRSTSGTVTSPTSLSPGPKNPLQPDPRHPDAPPA